ncbi:MAG: hypothetical protein WAO83_17570 [Fuerstiella sp.]
MASSDDQPTRLARTYQRPRHCTDSEDTPRSEQSSQQPNNPSKPNNCPSCPPKKTLQTADLLRIDNLNGTGIGPRENGSYLLNTSTLINDNAVDKLFGSSGSDWFLGTLDEDLFKDINRKEQQN